MGFIIVCMVVMAIIAFFVTLICIFDWDDMKGAGLSIACCMLLGLAASTLTLHASKYEHTHAAYTKAQQQYETVLAQYNKEIEWNRDLVLNVKTLEISLEAQATKVAKAHVAIQEARREGELQKVQCMQVQAEAIAEKDAAVAKLDSIQNLLGAK